MYMVYIGVYGGIGVGDVCIGVHVFSVYGGIGVGDVCIVCVSCLALFLFIGLEFSCNYSTWSLMSLVV